MVRPRVVRHQGCAVAGQPPPASAASSGASGGGPGPHGMQNMEAMPVNRKPPHSSRALEVGMVKLIVNDL